MRPGVTGGGVRWWGDGGSRGASCLKRGIPQGHRKDLGQVLRECKGLGPCPCGPHGEKELTLTVRRVLDLELWAGFTCIDKNQEGYW